jgi:prepilin-type N-terminal cleavage/methylation domain-containing protein
LRKPKAFTLIEVLVVIAIFAIVAMCVVGTGCGKQPVNPDIAKANAIAYMSHNYKGLVQDIDYSLSVKADDSDGDGKVLVTASMLSDGKTTSTKELNCEARVDHSGEQYDFCGPYEQKVKVYNE